MSLALIAAAALSQAQAAPPPPEVEAVRAQQMEQLDAWLAQDDYRAIGDEVQALSDPVEAAATLDWLGRQFQQGESAFISWQYSELLSAFAQGPKGITAQRREQPCISYGSSPLYLTLRRIRSRPSVPPTELSNESPRVAASVDSWEASASRSSAKRSISTH